MHALEPRLLLSANLVFNDDFNLPAGTQPSTGNWYYNLGNDPNNTNVQYSDTPSTLQIVNDAGATDGKALAMTLSRDPNNAGHYLSARINTSVDLIAGNEQYGHIEARIKLPGGPNGQGVGIWPAFWMLGNNIGTVGWPNCGEIDIMENKGSTPGEILGTIHGPGYSGGSGITAKYDLPGGQTFYSGYHVFAADWGPNFVNFLVDGHLYASRTPANLPAGTTWAFNHPFYIILDVAEGGAFAGGPGPNSVFPQTMLVDYVRATAFPLSAAPPLVDADIGSPGMAGSSNFDGLKWTINGGGSDIFGTSDQFHFASEAFNGGDLTITARVANLLDTGDYAKAGIMIRNGTATNAAYAFTFVTPNTGAQSQGANFEYRAAAGASAQGAGSMHGVTAPQWLRLVRIGDTFTAYASADGVNWTQNGPSEMIPMGASVNVGLAVDAYNNAALNTAMFSSVSIVPGGWTDEDIGGPAASGSAAFDPTSGNWTAGGGGSDIWGTADQFNFVSRALAGNGSVTAQVTAVANTDAFAKAGVMLRSDDTAGSPFANVNVTAGHGVIFEWRSTAGGAAASVTIAGVVAPAWVRVTRFGNSFSGFYSTDGSHWTQIGGSQTITMNATALAGLAVTAHNNDTLNGATFAGVAVQPSAVVGRSVFYNNSTFDGNDPAVGSSDDGAIATDKTALLPGQTASAANFTSFFRGINGVMVDMTGLTNGGALSAADFAFRVGTGGDPGTWAAAPTPSSVTVRAGPGGADRVEIVWADNAIQNEWLQVIVKADGNTGLAVPDVFYFGNLIGDANGNGQVTVADVAMTKSFSGLAADITSPVDFNRNGQVTVADVAIAKANSGNALTMISAPASAAAAAAAAPADVSVAADGTSGRIRPRRSRSIKKIWQPMQLMARRFDNPGG
jgi:beta-glucanase (GH16 family)